MRRSCLAQLCGSLARQVSYSAFPPHWRGKSPIPHSRHTWLHRLNPSSWLASQRGERWGTEWPPSRPGLMRSWLRANKKLQPHMTTTLGSQNQALAPRHSVQCFAACSDANVRQLAAVLLRKRISKHWQKLSADVSSITIGYSRSERGACRLAQRRIGMHRSLRLCTIKFGCA